MYINSTVSFFPQKYAQLKLTKKQIILASNDHSKKDKASIKAYQKTQNP